MDGFSLWKNHTHTHTHTSMKLVIFVHKNRYQSRRHLQDLLLVRALHGRLVVPLVFIAQMLHQMPQAAKVARYHVCFRLGNVWNKRKHVFKNFLVRCLHVCCRSGSETGSGSANNMLAVCRRRIVGDSMHIYYANIQSHSYCRVLIGDRAAYRALALLARKLTTWLWNQAMRAPKNRWRLMSPSIRTGLGIRWGSPTVDAN